MYSINIKNCNSICCGEIKIEQNKLNIKYGINGTGKTTIAKALRSIADNDELQKLQSFFSTEPASISSNPVVKKVLVFDEEFVNRVVFKEDEVIDNTFEIFLKTSDYEIKKGNLDKHLASLHDIIKADIGIVTIKELLEKINKKFSRTATGNIRRSGAFKSMLAKNNIYNIPEELNEYQLFIQNKDINIPWIDWKNKGDEFDIGENCPYCTERIDRTGHEKRKGTFKRVFNKADSRNLREILELIESLEGYIEHTKYKELISYIKEDTPEDIIESIISKLLLDSELILNRIEAIESFGRRKLVIADISQLENQVRSMLIPMNLLELIRGEKIEEVMEEINSNVNLLINEIGLLKREIGDLKGVLRSSMEKSQKDINEFLRTAGIKYELIIEAEDENSSRTLLRQCYTSDRTNVTNIRSHLSWGEKNAFALILFMYYACTQNPDLIILDDPISSFDSNKKYAILHRMFKNTGGKGISLINKTVLLLTHDFQPIIDFIVVGKLDDSRASVNFIWNEERILHEREIDVKQDIKVITKECEDIAATEDVNIISRIAFLRKLCELNGRKGIWDIVYEILSCLIHASEIRRKITNDKYVDIDSEEVKLGLSKIREYVNDFDFDYIKDSYYNIEKMKDMYFKESNTYLKMQIFREMIEVAPSNSIRLSMADDAWFKFIDETYHIENDFLYYLDVLKFNIVPEYIKKFVDDIVNRL